MTTAVLAIFLLVYLAMILGGLPFLQLDRTGVALLGAIAIVGTSALTPEQAAAAVHLPTVLLLFAFMVIVVNAAARRGVRIDWKMHARVGVPVTLATLAIAAGWLALRAAPF